MPPPGKRAPALVSVALICLSLGLPWATGSEFLIGTPAYVPSFCTPGLGGEAMSCSPSYIVPGTTMAASITPGAASDARVFLVGALALTAFALWRNRPSLFRIAAVVLGASILLVGLAANGGQLTAIAAAVLLWWSARRAGDRNATPAARTPSPWDISNATLESRID